MGGYKKKLISFPVLTATPLAETKILDHLYAIMRATRGAQHILWGHELENENPFQNFWSPNSSLIFLSRQNHFTLLLRILKGLLAFFLFKKLFFLFFPKYPMVYSQCKTSDVHVATKCQLLGFEEWLSPFWNRLEYHRVAEEE